MADDESGVPELAWRVHYAAPWRDWYDADGHMRALAAAGRLRDLAGIEHRPEEMVMLSVPGVPGVLGGAAALLRQDRDVVPVGLLWGAVRGMIERDAEHRSAVDFELRLQLYEAVRDLPEVVASTRGERTPSFGVAAAVALGATQAFEAALFSAGRRGVPETAVAEAVGLPVSMVRPLSRMRGQPWALLRATLCAMTSFA